MNASQLTTSLCVLIIFLGIMLLIGECHHAKSRVNPVPISSSSSSGGNTLKDGGTSSSYGTSAGYKAKQNKENYQEVVTKLLREERGLFIVDNFVYVICSSEKGNLVYVNIIPLIHSGEYPWKFIPDSMMEEASLEYFTGAELAFSKITSLFPLSTKIGFAPNQQNVFLKKLTNLRKNILQWESNGQFVFLSECGTGGELTAILTSSELVNLSNFK